MGGCRCTYRNCTVRSDGQTHLFHYPVLDKLRCHQWLTNAQRQDFLRLKVSQLKNRVVCQHHFTDDMFMNFKKDKLKHFAVPTENGPHCDCSNFDQDENQVLSPIKVEYIDNEIVNNIDKEKVFSKKYGDFLANCEVMEIDPELDKDLIARSKGKMTRNVKPLDNHLIKQLPSKGTKARSLSILKGSIKSIKPVTAEQNNELIQNQIVTSSSYVNNNKNTNSRVKIISEEKFAQPLPVMASLVPVSPYFVLQKPDVKKSVEEKRTDKIMQVENYLEKMFESPENINFRVRSETVPITFDVQDARHPQQSEPMIYEPIMPTENTPVQELKAETTYEVIGAGHPQQSEPMIYEPIMPTEITPIQELKLETPLNKSKWRSPTKSLLKSPSQRIISHERIAAIQEKRKFNMKLRDIVNDSLHKLDERVQDVPDKVTSDLNVSNQHLKSIILNNEPEPQLPDSQKCFIDLLDKRMKKMEETLLNRIDVNSQQIRQLNNTIYTPEKRKTMSVYTQTKLDKEAHKKSLYNEISQYLSSEAKSKVYEELFLNEISVKRKKTLEKPKYVVYTSKNKS